MASQKVKVNHFQILEIKSSNPFSRCRNFSVASKFHMPCYPSLIPCTLSAWSIVTPATNSERPTMHYFHFTDLCSEVRQ